MVMSKEDAARIERLQAVHPRGRGRRGLGMAFAMRSTREEVRAVGGGGVVALTSHDHTAVSALNDQRLMSFGMAGCWDQEDTGQHLSLAVEFLVPSPFDELGKRVVLRGPRRHELGRLDEDRAIPEQGIAAAMVKVQVTVRHICDLFQASADSSQCGPQILSPGPVMSVDVGI